MTAAQPSYDVPVKPRPWQAVQPRRNAREIVPRRTAHRLGSEGDPCGLFGQAHHEARRITSGRMS